MVTYKYNEVDVFSGIAGAPLLSRGEEIINTGSRLARADTITLSGQLRKLTCAGGFQETYNQTKLLIQRFADNFKKFEILENGISMFSHDNAIIESISFDENRFYDLIPFTIRIICYQDDYAGSYGVLDPSESFEYSEDDGCLVTITHTISARGINNSTDAFINAKNFVTNLSGLSNLFDPAGYSVTDSDLPILIKRSENSDKLSGQYSLTEVYLFDKANNADDGRHVLNYSTDLSESNGDISVSIQGRLKGSVSSEFQTMRGNFSVIDFYTIANTEYSNKYSGNLTPTPVGFSVTENSDEVSIDFSISYRNNGTTDPYLIDTTTITSDSDGNSCIRVELIIRSDYGCPNTRLAKTKAYLDTFDLDAYVDARWLLYGDGSTLGNVPSSKSLGVNNENGDITVGITYCSNNFEDCGCLENFNYSMSFSPAIPQFSGEASYQGEGCYYIQDLKYDSRSKFSVDGSARPSKCCTLEETKSQIYTRVNQIMIEYFDATDIILDQASIEFSEDKSVVSFSFGWNGLESVLLSDEYIYATFEPASEAIVTSVFAAENESAMILESGEGLGAEA